MGCGQCASVCPTGAAAYDYPSPATLLTRIRTLLLAYRKAGAKILCFCSTTGVMASS